MEDWENSTVQPSGAEEVRLMFCKSTLPLLVILRVRSLCLLALASKLSRPLGVDRSRHMYR